ncbi:MAG: hypothetical protein KGP28_11210 [Bdellovibrionales bacterium]|nr:hypothetical protein [Bdellovibrionales bacterium]
MSKKPVGPAEEELTQAYRILQAKESIDPSSFVRFAQWVRFDPRLGELWLEAFDRQWQQESPILFRDANLKQAIPAVLGVLLDQYRTYFCPKPLRSAFVHWSAIALEGVVPAPFQQFFIGVLPFAGKQMRENAERPARAYLKWGFLGRDVFLNKFLEKQKTLQKTGLGLEQRMRILSELLKAQERITVSDYLSACDHLISRRVAQKDLSGHPRLRCMGNTRAKFYLKTTGGSK